MFFMVNELIAHFQHLYLTEDLALVLEQHKDKDLLNLKFGVHSAYQPRPHLIMYSLQVSLKTRGKK